MVFRPDWEAVIGPVVDFAVTRPEVDPSRIALMGISFGGYLAPRAASGEPRWLPASPIRESFPFSKNSRAACRLSSA